MRSDSSWSRGHSQGVPAGIGHETQTVGRAARMPMSAEEHEPDTRIRQWPRTPKTDPYQSGQWRLSAGQPGGGAFCSGLQRVLCAHLGESVEELIKQGATHITVATTMVTPGGSHCEVEIPEILDHLRPQHPEVELRYPWPFDLQQVAKTLADQVRQYS